MNLPPPTRGKAQQPPPRPAKASILQQNPNEPSTSNGRYFSGSSSSQHTSHQQLSQSPQTPQQQQSAFQPYHKQQQQHVLPQISPESYLLQQNHFSQTDCYVGITIQKSPSLTAAAASTNAVESPSPPTSSTRKSSKSQANGSSHLLVSLAAPNINHYRLHLTLSSSKLTN